MENAPGNSQFLDTLLDQYAKLSYWDNYGGSILLVIFITLVVLAVVVLCQVLIAAQPIRQDWPNQRCKPHVVPFAGFINKPDNMTAFEYTKQNFDYCSQTILASMAGYYLQPLTFITASLQEGTADVQQSIQSVRAMFNKVRNSMKTVAEEIMERLVNFTVPLQEIIIKMRDLIAKTQGVMTAGLMTMLGTYYTLKSLMGAVVQFIISIMVSMAAAIAIMWIFPFTWGTAAAGSVVFASIAVPMAIILVYMRDVLHINTHFSLPHLPKPPKLKCLAGATRLALADGTSRLLRDIRPGDVLAPCHRHLGDDDDATPATPEEPNTVTAVICVETRGSLMFDIGGVLVSDTHLVLDARRNEWVRAAHHSDAKRCTEFADPVLYCLSTAHGAFEVAGVRFSDWHEFSLPGGGISVSPPFLQGDGEQMQVQVYDASRNRFAWKDFDNVQIGDCLDSEGNAVYGVVRVGADSRMHLLTAAESFVVRSRAGGQTTWGVPTRVADFG